MLIKSLISWLISQLPGIALGFFGLLATGFVNELFTVRSEDRKKKEELLEKLSEIFIEAEENMWKNDLIREKDFIRYCRKLSQYNFKLADDLLLNYYILWCGVWAQWIKPRKEWIEEEVKMHNGSIKDLKDLNLRFLNYAYPDNNLLRNLEYKKWQFGYKIKYFLKRNKDKRWNKLVELGRKATNNLLSNPFNN